MDTPIELQKLEYTFDVNNKFIINPIGFYYVRGLPKELTRRIVIFYEFIYINKKKLISSIIPLYLSDGKSNGFRGNLLLPFLCIESGNRKDTCPFKKKITPGLLYKLKPCHDLDSDKLFDDIIQNIESVHPDYKTTTEYTDLIKLNGGIFTVLPRMDSFILFFLNIVNSKFKYISENNYDIRIFQPLLRFPMLPSVPDDDNPQQYTKDFVFDYPHDNIVNVSKLLFAKCMIDKLLEFYKSAIVDDKLTVIYITKKLSEFKSIEVNELNKEIEVCRQNKINPEYYDNYKIFNEIGIKFSSLYKSTPNILSSFVADDMHCYTLDNSLEKFKISCSSEEMRRKYLKYKQKYLELKKDF